MPPTKQQDNKKPSEPDKVNRQQLTSLIAKQVIDGLGQPKDLLTVQVRALWAAHYRVNVLVSSENTIRFAHSYFVSTDPKGTITASSPAITKEYAAS